MTTKHLFFTFALAAAAPVFGAPPAASADTHVVVIFENPEKFKDVRDSDAGTDRGREGYLALLKEHLEQFSPRYLTEGQTLTVTFTDIDMAGEFEGWRGQGFDDIRIVKDIYPPRLNFSFKLTDAKGAVVKEGERKLVDHAFQLRASIDRRAADALYYEKIMLSEWLRDEFAAPKKTAKSG